MKRYLLRAFVCLACIGLLCSCNPSAQPDSPTGVLAVLGAFDAEVALLEGMLTDAQSHEVEGIRFVSGRLAGEPVVVASTGIGKVNTAMTTTLLIEHFRPRSIIFTGIAGAVDPNLEPGDIVIAEKTAHHDMGILWPEGVEHGGVKNRLTGDDNPVFFPADPTLLAVAARVAERTAFDPIPVPDGTRLPKVIVGTIVTGDVFVASEDKCAELAETLGADAVEMEGAAVAQLCYQRGIGCVIIRSMADKADESAVLDKQKFYTMAARNSAHLVAQIVADVGP